MSRPIQDTAGHYLRQTGLLRLQSDAGYLLLTAFEPGAWPYSVPAAEHLSVSKGCKSPLKARPE